MNLRLPALLLFSSISLSAYSVPVIDFSVTAGQWQPDYSGEIGQNSNTADLDDLGFDDDDHNVITAIFKHPVPFIPNVRLQQTDLDTEASGTLKGTLEIDGTVFSGNETVDTDLDLSHKDITLFYSPINNWVQFDIGLTGRHFDGEIAVVGSATGKQSVDFDDWIPMLYVGTRAELPLTGLYVDAHINAIGYDGNRLSDVTAALGYVAKLPGIAGLAAELGYRTFTLDIEDINNFEGDIDIKGLYVKVGIQF